MSKILKHIIDFASDEVIRKMKEDLNPGDCPHKNECKNYEEHAGDCYHMYQTIDGTYDCFVLKDGGT